MSGDNDMREIVRDEVRKALGEMAGSSPMERVQQSQPSGPSSLSQSEIIPQVSNIVARARQIMSYNSSSMSSTAQRALQSYPKRRRVAAVHSYQKEPKKGEEKTIELVCILPFSRQGASAIIPDYSLTKEDIYLSGAVTLTTVDSEDEIRLNVLEVLNTRLPYLKKGDFEFVKVLRKCVVTPIVKPGQKFDYKMVKTLMGQGKLYVRLLKSPDNNPTEVVELDSSDHEQENAPSAASAATSSTNTHIFAAADYVEDEETTMLGQLKVIFPQHPNTQLREACRSAITISDAINEVLNSTDDKKSLCADMTPLSTVEDVLKQYCSQVPLEGRSLFADINRDRLWQSSLILYKSKTREELLRPIKIFFEGPYNEFGVDAGGLKVEYFGELLRTIDEQLFEGEEKRRIPLHSWEKLSLMQLAGVMISHSILHGGPGFPVLAPYISNYIVTAEKDLAAGYVHKEDLPNTPANKTLASFIQELLDARSDEAISDVLGRNEYLQLVDRSGWPVGKLISQNSKEEFVNQLLAEELITKRITALENLRVGLNHFGLLDLCARSMEIGCKLFSASNTNSISAEKLLSCFGKVQPSTPREQLAYDNMRRFIMVNEAA